MTGKISSFDIESQCRENIDKKLKTIPTNDQEKYKYDIVISSAYSDRNMVQKIQQFLINEGYQVWSERNHNFEHRKMIIQYSLTLPIRHRSLTF